MSANIEKLVSRTYASWVHAKGTGWTDHMCNALTEQAEAFKGELQAYDGMVRELTKTVEEMQAAQSVPVVGEPVAWGVTKRHEDNVWFISDSRFTAQYYAQMYAHRIGENPDQVVIPLYRKPATSISAAELERLQQCEDVLRSLACSLSAGGYNADVVDPVVFEKKIRDGIDMLIAPLTAENERLQALADSGVSLARAVMADQTGRG